MRRITLLTTILGKNNVNPDKLRKVVTVNKASITPQTRSALQYVPNDTLLKNKFAGLDSAIARKAVGDCNVSNVEPFRYDVDCQDGTSIGNILKQLHVLKQNDSNLGWIPNRPSLLAKVENDARSNDTSHIYRSLPSSAKVDSDMVLYVCEASEFKVNVTSENGPLSRVDKMKIPTAVMSLHDLKKLLSQRYSIPVVDQILLISTSQSKSIRDVSSESFHNEILLNLGITFESGGGVSIFVKNVNYELDGVENVEAN